MPKTWVQNVGHVRDGEEVRASVTGRATRALEKQTGYLKERLEGLEESEAVFARGQIVEPDAAVGMAVYFDTADQRFERALAALETDPSTGALVTAPSSDVVGVIWFKESSTTADILLLGKARLALDAAVDGAPIAGQYYLSAVEPGKLVRRRPGLGVPVLFATGTDDVVICRPVPRDLTEGHVHYKLSLVTFPAGTVVPPDAGERHVITNPDESLPGWLPAGHASFQGLAPPKAAFGYNLDQHPELARLWPPLPEDAASVTLFRNDVDGYGSELPMGPRGLVVVDRNGIWWMSDCYGDVPWETSLNNTDSTSSSLVSSAGPECPRDTVRALVLYFAKVQFATDKGVVTSLEPADPLGPLAVLNCDGDPAKTGALKIAFNGRFLIDRNDEAGSLVVKSVTNAGKLNRGRVIEGVKAADASVTVVGTHEFNAGTAEEPDPYQQGLVTIRANIEPAERIILPQLIRVNDAKERYYQADMYLGLPPARASDLRLKFRLPGADGFPASPKLKLRVVLLARTAGTIPTLTLAYRRIPRPSGATPLPVTDTALALTTGLAVGADEYAEFESAAFTVAAHDVVLFSLVRGASDGYAGELGVLDVVAVLAEG